MLTLTAVEEYLADCLARGLAPATIRSYHWALSRLLDHCPAMPQRGRQLRPVLAQPHLAHETRHNLYNYLTHFFRWALMEYSLKNPLDEVRRSPHRRTLPRVLTPDERRSLWDSSPTQTDRALIALPLDTGIRLGEIASLTWPNVGPDYIRVQGKRGQRQVPVSPEVKRLLLGLGDGHHLWVGAQGPLTWGGLQQRYQRLYRAAGIYSVKNGAHTLRHTFATHYIANGGNLFSLMEILGHTSITTTQLYVHLAQKYTKVDHSLYSPAQELFKEA